jgi:chitinase
MRVNAHHQPRLVLYHQTIHDGARYVSLLPLLAYDAGVTHLIIAAIHLNGHAARNPIHLNDLPPNSSHFDNLWNECKLMKTAGIKVMCMLGGAAKGTYRLLDGPQRIFEEQYGMVRNLVEYHAFDGIDLDVEERMSQEGVIRLIERLRRDFGEDFIISLAPVATAMHGGRNLSGFNYLTLEVSNLSKRIYIAAC